MPLRALDGAIELLLPLLVDETVLGVRFPIQLHDGDAELWFPALPKDAQDQEMHSLECPLPNIPKHVISAVRWGHGGFGKHPDHPRPLASWVETVAFRAHVDVDASRKPWDYAIDFGAQFDSWLAVAEKWIRLWAPLAASQRNIDFAASSGHYSDSSDDPGCLTGWQPPLSGHVVRRSTEALDRTTLTAAMHRASVGEEPPTTWVFLLRARQAADPRTAVIEAATGVEVALARCLHDRLSALPEAARDRLILGANGLVGLLRLMEDIDGVAVSSWKRAAHRLANPRNDAVHAGLVPSDLSAALEEAKSILSVYSPLPFPVD